ncbi:hypothetical protein C1H46_014932 [Malus baccata]|uniref:Uncharacterized protein n=1 Tax=Malus baccata TaxID=106549 RepID=A0A540MKZ7_MALBA|nr:hypothetical protein C1H46_014932 [Malus baccata]
MAIDLQILLNNISLRRNGNRPSYSSKSVNVLLTLLAIGLSEVKHKREMAIGLSIPTNKKQLSDSFILRQSTLREYSIQSQRTQLTDNLLDNIKSRQSALGKYNQQFYSN